MLWAVEKGIFQFFAHFWVTKLKQFPGKVNQNAQNYLNQNLVIGSFLKNGFEATLNSNTNLLCFWKVHFSVVCKLLSDEVGPLFGKVRKSVQNYLNQNLAIGSFLENGFKATLSSKTNVLSVSKGHFSVFCKVLSDEVETVFWENETMLRKLFP